MSEHNGNARAQIQREVRRAWRDLFAAKLHVEVTVRDARRRGLTWGEIADALGMSRQDAWERFATAEGEE